jgi:oxygen-independent coproporphyrinogen III oxidase
VSTFWSQPPWLEPRTAYVHIPFCGHQCGYCDFAVTSGQDHLIETYLDALEIELGSLREARPVESLFIGGGTPTYLKPDQLHRMMTAINRWLPRVGSRPEVSIESTPESWNQEKVEILAEAGVNRASIGVQSFQKHLLKALDRQHTVDDIPLAIEMIRERIPSISMDLIFAAPGQTLAEWQQDLATATALNPEHISTYGLTYEKGTALWKARRRGRVQSASEELERSMYIEAVSHTTQRGYEQYEISNFSKPGHRSAHNGRYWANDAYYGFGVGAARYVYWSRELNVRDTKTYIRRVLAGESPTFQDETLTPRERAMETVAVQLRRMEGITSTEFAERTGFELRELLRGVLDPILDLGYLTWQEDQLQLTEPGKLVADGVIEQLMKSVAC